MTPDQQQRVMDSLSVTDRYDEIDNVVFDRTRISFTVFDLNAQQDVNLWITVQSFFNKFEGANGLFIPCIQYDSEGYPEEKELQVWDYGTDIYRETPEWFNAEQIPEQRKITEDIILNIINSNLSSQLNHG